MSNNYNSPNLQSLGHDLFWSAASPIRKAIVLGDFEEVKYLLNNLPHSKLLEKNLLGQNLEEFARYISQSEIADLIAEQMQLNNQLIESFAAKSRELVKSLFKCSTNPDEMKSLLSKVPHDVLNLHGKNIENLFRLLNESQIADLIAKQVQLNNQLIDAVTVGNKKSSESSLKNLNANPDAVDEDGTPLLHLAVLGGNIDIVKMLIAHRANGNLTDRFGRTAIQLAIENPRPGVLAELLKIKDINPNIANEIGETPLLTAIRLGHCDMLAELLKHPELDPNIGNNVRSLEEAINLENPTLINSNHEKESDVLPLQLAIQLGNKESVELLLKHPKIDLNARDFLSNTALQYAAEYALQKGDANFMELLLARGGMSADILNRDGETLLCNLMNESRNYSSVREVITLLLKHGANIYQPDRFGHTPLKYAAEYVLQHADGTPLDDFLSYATSNINDQETYFFLMSILNYAVHNCSYETVQTVFKVLTKHDIYMDKNNTEILLSRAIHQAFVDGDCAHVKDLLNSEKKVDLNAMQPNPLIFVIRMVTEQGGSDSVASDLLKTLLQNGADAYHFDSSGYSALAYALDYGLSCNDFRIVEYLLQNQTIAENDDQSHSFIKKSIIEASKKADKEPGQNDYEQLSMLFGVLAQYPDSLHLDEKTKLVLFNRALNRVLFTGNAQFMDALLSLGIDPSELVYVNPKRGVSINGKEFVNLALEEFILESDGQLENAINLLVMLKQKDIVIDLSYKAQVALLKHSFQAVLDYQNYTFIKNLVQYDLVDRNISLKERNGENPLGNVVRLAINSEKYSEAKELVLFLVRNGADCNHRDAEGYSPLRRVLEYELNGGEGSYGAVKGMLNAGAKVTSIEDSLILAIKVAIRNNYYQSVRGLVPTLMEHGVALDFKDEKGKTAIDYAVEYVCGPAQYDNYIVINDILDAELSREEKGVSLASVNSSEDCLLCKVIKDLSEKKLLDIDFYIEIVEKMLKSKLIDKNVVDKETGKTALHYAVESKSSELIDILLQGGVDPNIRDINGKTALHSALKIGIESNDYAVMKSLLPITKSRNFNIKARNKVGDSNMNETSSLVSFNLNLSDAEGKTPLFIAAEHAIKTGKFGAMKMLLKAGANPEVENQEGKTTLFYVTDIMLQNSQKRVFNDVQKEQNDITAKESNKKPDFITPVKLAKKALALLNKKINRQKTGDIGDLIGSVKESKKYVKAHASYASNYSPEIKANCKRAASLLVRYGADPNKQLHSKSPLSNAVNASSVELVNIFLKKNALKIDDLGTEIAQLATNYANAPLGQAATKPGNNLGKTSIDTNSSFQKSRILG